MSRHHVVLQLNDGLLSSASTFIRFRRPHDPLQLDNLRTQATLSNATKLLLRRNSELDAVATGDIIPSQATKQITEMTLELVPRGKSSLNTAEVLAADEGSVHNPISGSASGAPRLNVVSDGRTDCALNRLPNCELIDGTTQLLALAVSCWLLIIGDEMRSKEACVILSRSIA